MYHPYREGFSVLPKLHKLGNEKIFCFDDQYDHYQRAKQEAIKTQNYFVEHNIDSNIYDPICDFLVNRIGEEFPDFCIEEPHTFENIALQLQEDLVIHRMDEEKDWLAAGCVCFPSDWLPEVNVGKPLREIHARIPGIDLNASRKMINTMVHHGPFFRFVWGVVHSDEINSHPSKPRVQFNPNNPIVYVKVERQVTYGFPDLGASLFILRQHIVKDIDVPALAKALSEMSQAEKDYKGISEEVISFLSASSD